MNRYQITTMNESDISLLTAATPAPVNTAQVIGLSELPEHAEASASIAASGNPLHSIKVRLQVCVGEASMTVGELLAATEHQVVALDRQVEQPIDLVLDGRVVARGQLVAVDGVFGVRLTELPLPLKL